MKDKVKCPIKAGVNLSKRSILNFILKHFQDEWKYDMEPVFDYPVSLSSMTVGKWRFTMEVDFDDNGSKKSACVRYFGDIVEL